MTAGKRLGAEWQDIATAPRDGTPCLFFAKGRRGAYATRAKTDHMVVDAFDAKWPRGRHQLPEAPYLYWFPLPAPPVVKP